MSQIATMKRSAQREADARMKPQQLLKEVETLAAVVQTFRACVSDMHREAQATRENLEGIRRASQQQHRGMLRTILMTASVTGVICTILMTSIVWFTLLPTRPGVIEGRILKIMASPDVPQDVKDWLSSNVISPTR